jgi:acyl-CoA thioester hydrolase
MQKNKITIRVRYDETDKMAVVHHANFFHFFEVGRTEFMRTAGFVYSQLEKEGIFLPVIEAYCRYKGNVSYDDEITITTSGLAKSKATIKFNYSITTNDGKEIVNGYTLHAFVNSDGKPIRIPQNVILCLEKIGK